MQQSVRDFRDRVKEVGIAVRVGFFLAVRDVKRANIWTTVLITFVMTLTFLNLIVIRGILVGLTEGSVRSYRDRYTGNVFLSTLDKKSYIEDSHLPIELLKSLSQVKAVSARYISPGTLEAEYKTQTRRDEDSDKVNTTFVGINPDDERMVSGLSSLIIRGEYLNPQKRDQVVVGVSLLKKYGSAAGTGSPSLETADVGSVLRLTIQNTVREVVVVGVVKGKVTNIDSRVFMLNTELRPMMGRDDFNVNEIAVKTETQEYEDAVLSILRGNSIDSLAKVQSWKEAQPQFIRDIAATFAVLGDLIGGIGLVVASITIFIVIFVNAITRRKFIGILKGIGINALTIESSYVFQSLFYATAGTGIGMCIVYGLFVPYFSTRPINFPFSDGIFVADLQGVLLRVVTLLIATVIAGYIPARIVVKQPTLDAILGR